MKKLKIIAPQWENYTGSLGIVHFTNGLSDQFVPDHVRRRLSIGMAMVEIDTQGNEASASPTHKMIVSATIRAEVNEPLNRQSDTDKAHELLETALNIDANTPIHTKEQLEKIADKEGIKGLREVADRWHVKHRSIPTLINMILDAQERFVANRQKHHVERIAEELAANEALKQAALTGDLTAALNINAQQQENTQAAKETQTPNNRANDADNASESTFKPVQATVSNEDTTQTDLEDYLLNLPDNEADKHP